MALHETQQDVWKRLAGEAAARLVEDGMLIGLGSGSTARAFIQALGQRVQAGLHISGAVASSQVSHDLATSLGIPCGDLETYSYLDLYIDGADEIDPNLQLIKGAGGAHLYEKVVATVSHRFVVIGDITKQVTQLGQRFPVPVETIPFALVPVRQQLEALGACVELRQKNGETFVTESHNFILDCTFPGGISHAPRLDAQLQSIVGVVETGLFLNMAQKAIIAGPEGLQVILA